MVACLAARLDPMQGLQGLQSEGVIRSPLASQAGFVYSDRATGNLRFALKSENLTPGGNQRSWVPACSLSFGLPAAYQLGTYRLRLHAFRHRGKNCRGKLL